MSNIFPGGAKIFLGDALLPSDYATGHVLYVISYVSSFSSDPFKGLCAEKKNNDIGVNFFRHSLP